MKESNPETRKERLPLRTLMGYGSSMIGINSTATMISVHLMFFYTDVIALNPRTVGLVMALAQVWDAIAGPVMGYLSDNTRWKWGRRRPYIILGSIPAAVTYYLLFSPSDNFFAGGVSWFFAVILFLFFAFRTIWETPYAALGPEVTLDYDERTRLSAYQQAFASGGDILGTMAPVILIGIFSTQRKDFSFIGALMGALAIGAALWTYVGTRENRSLRQESTLSVGQSLKALLGNRPFVLLVITSSCAAISNYTTLAVIRYVIKYWFHKQAIEGYFFGAFFVGVFLSIPIWIKVINRIGKKAAYIMTMLIYSAILWLILVLRQGDYVIFGTIMVVAGAFNVALWLIAGSIVPDIIEWDQLQVGERREGAFYGLWMFIRKAAIGGSYIIVSMLLERVGYVPNVPQTGRALLGIRLLFGPIPSVLLIVGMLVFLKYPITKQVHRDLLRQIEERRKGATPD